MRHRLLKPVIEDSVGGEEFHKSRYVRPPIYLPMTPYPTWCKIPPACMNASYAKTQHLGYLGIICLTTIIVVTDTLCILAM